MWHDDMPGWGMGYGWMAALLWMLALLAIAAPVNHLFFDNRRK